jgi:hypothetical protein
MITMPTLGFSRVTCRVLHAPAKKTPSTVDSPSSIRPGYTHTNGTRKLKESVGYKHRRDPFRVVRGTASRRSPSTSTTKMSAIYF